MLNTTTGLSMCPRGRRRAILALVGAAAIPAVPALAVDASTQPTSAVTDAPTLHGLLAPESARRIADGDLQTVQAGVYNRPFVAASPAGTSRVAVGGYLEANAHYAVEDGVREGFSFEFRRFNLFTFAQIAEVLSLFSELEFEHGTEEIELETALVDVLVDPRLNFRAGILLPPIGRFNVNHDSPLYAFVDRPLASTQIIPSTLSEVGAGAYGRFGLSETLQFTYDIYAVNGLGDGVVFNSEARTFIPAGKHDERFEADNNGRPAVTSRLGLHVQNVGEIGVSHYGGAYNTFRIEGERVAPTYRLDIFAADWSAEWHELSIEGELAWAWVDVPRDLQDLFGGKQYGLYTDVLYPVFKHKWFSEHESVLYAAARIDRIDYNVGTFSTGAAAGDKIFDEQTALTVGLAFRPVPDAVLRLHYRAAWVRDFLGNPAAKPRAIQAGLATYF